MSDRADAKRRSLSPFLLHCPINTWFCAVFNYSNHVKNKFSVSLFTFSNVYIKSVGSPFGSSLNKYQNQNILSTKKPIFQTLLKMKFSILIVFLGGKFLNSLYRWQC